MADRHEIDEVRERTDIVSVIEPYVTLKRAGKNLKGLCPFHQERTPSFQVSPDLGRWYCFGQCGEGGDVFKFLQKIENLTFVEALERLALRAGVTLTRLQPSGGGGGADAAPEIGERDRLYQINRLALRYFRECLGRAPQARAYLQQRGLVHDTQEAFFIGFAPDDWEGLTAFLSRQGARLADADLAGLVSKSERGGYYDKLRGRLIFPIFDVQERPIAFGGRLIEEAKPGQPKYWNSPETPVFSKSRTLYGLWRARKAIAAQGQAVIVEGYTDVVAAHQAGFENVVATLGTSLTEEHVKILARLAPTVLLAFDADSAGLRAAFRAAEIFEAQEVEVRVLDLPAGEDPDSLIQAGRHQVFAQAIAQAVPLIEYRLKRLIAQVTPSSDQSRIALFRKALPVVAAVPSTIERDQYVRMLAPYHPQYASGATFAEEHIRQDIRAFQGTRQNNGWSAPAFAPRREYAPPPLPTTRVAGEQAERHLLRALVSGDPELAGIVLTGITPDEFWTPDGRALAATLYAHYAATQSLEVSGMLASVQDEALAGLLTTLLISEEEPLSPPGIEGEILYLKTQAKKRRVLELTGRINSGDASVDDLREHKRLQSELKGTSDSRRQS